MDFKIVGEITGIETIAVGTSIREVARLSQDLWGVMEKKKALTESAWVDPACFAGDGFCEEGLPKTQAGRKFITSVAHRAPRDRHVASLLAMNAPGEARLSTEKPEEPIS